MFTKRHYEFIAETLKAYGLEGPRQANARDEMARRLADRFILASRIGADGNPVFRRSQFLEAAGFGNVPFHARKLT